MVSRCTGSFSDGTLRSSASGVVCGFGVAWGASGLSGCVDGVVTCGASAFRDEGAGAAVAISEHAQRRPGAVLHLHSDWQCVGVLGRIASMFNGTWDHKQVAEDGSASLWRAVARRVCASYGMLGAACGLSGCRGIPTAPQTSMWCRICVTRCVLGCGALIGRY